jgi:hypothetical protein
MFQQIKPNTNTPYSELLNTQTKKQARSPTYHLASRPKRLLHISSLRLLGEMRFFPDAFTANSPPLMTITGSHEIMET